MIMLLLHARNAILNVLHAMVAQHNVVNVLLIVGKNLHAIVFQDITKAVELAKNVQFIVQLVLLLLSALHAQIQDTILQAASAMIAISC